MIVVLTGSTCSGKSAVVEELTNRGFFQITTTTTRPPRPTDKPFAYHFLSEEGFMQGITTNKFLESNQHGDYLYGVGLREIAQAIDSGDDWVITLDPSGHRKLKRYLEANKAPMLSVFLQADAKVRLKRLTEREGDIDRVMERFAVMLNTEVHWFRDESEYYDMALETDDFPIADVAGVIMQYVTARNSLSKKVS